NGQSSITPRDRNSTVRKILWRRPNPHLNPLPEGEEDENTSCDRDDSNTRISRATADNNELAARRRVARSIAGTAASFDAWRFPDERRARGRDRPQAEAGVRLSPPQPRKNRRDGELSRLDAVYRSSRLFLFDDEQ